MAKTIRNLSKDKWLTGLTNSAFLIPRLLTLEFIYEELKANNDEGYQPYLYLEEPSIKKIANFDKKVHPRDIVVLYYYVLQNRVFHGSFVLFSSDFSI